ncbi:MAG: carboxypeptidase regulatory-like domain-containing protein [Geobacteraceae bacterium]|nr:carboxypeptidase regulatory-like domain-containing protein [Geobacteraceae bacterium]
MRLAAIILIAVIMLPFAANGAEDNITLQGKVATLSGEPVANAEIYIYSTKNSRRPADFISPKTGDSGVYRLILPKASYWAVARVKKGERFGPLQPGDRHSGEPIKIEPDAESTISQDFSVADMQELAQSRLKGREELVEISGILSRSSKPLAGYYVFAKADRIIVTNPDYFSAWTDASGRYNIKLPPGRYFLGAAALFPPQGKSTELREVELLAGKLPVAINLQLPVE